MVPTDAKLVQMIIPTTAITAASTNTGYIDTLGYDYLQIHLMEMSASVDTQVTALEIAEDDTVPTATTSMTDIVALTGAAATSTSAGFVLPTPNSAVENNYQFNIDLKGRKRYIGIQYQTAVSTRACCVGLLLRGEEGAANIVSSDATATVTSASLRLNLFA